MTVKDLIFVLEGLNPDREVLYGVDKENVDWAHVCPEGVVLISEKNSEKVWS